MVTLAPYFWPAIAACLFIAAGVAWLSERRHDEDPHDEPHGDVAQVPPLLDERS